VSDDEIPRWLTSDYRLPRWALAEYEEAEWVWAVTEPVFDAIDPAADPEDLEAELRELTAGQRAFLVIHWCRSEVANGGFHQFFLNSAGALAREAVEGFERVGAPALADVVRRAIARFPRGGPDRDWGRRQEQLERQPEEWRGGFEPLDEEFYRLVGGPPRLDDVLLQYVRAHMGEFTREEA
jgi:hypothetical protein